jgi:hypothetical protein
LCGRGFSFFPTFGRPAPFGLLAVLAGLIVTSGNNSYGDLSEWHCFPSMGRFIIVIVGKQNLAVARFGSSGTFGIVIASAARGAASCAPFGNNVERVSAYVSEGVLHKCCSCKIIDWQDDPKAKATRHRSRWLRSIHRFAAREMFGVGFGEQTNAVSGDSHRIIKV